MFLNNNKIHMVKVVFEVVTKYSSTHVLYSEDQAYKSTFDYNDIELHIKFWKKNNILDTPSPKYILINNKGRKVLAFKRMQGKIAKNIFAYHIVECFHSLLRSACRFMFWEKKK